MKIDPETGERIDTYKKGDKAREREAALPKPVIIDKFQGQDLLLQKAVDDIKLKPLLKIIFPRDYQRILSCAFYTICEKGKAFAHMANW